MRFGVYRKLSSGLQKLGECQIASVSGRHVEVLHAPESDNLDRGALRPAEPHLFHVISIHAGQGECFALMAGDQADPRVLPGWCPEIGPSEGMISGIGSWRFSEAPNIRANSPASRMISPLEEYSSTAEMPHNPRISRARRRAEPTEGNTSAQRWRVGAV